MSDLVRMFCNWLECSNIYRLLVLIVRDRSPLGITLEDLQLGLQCSIWFVCSLVVRVQSYIADICPLLVLYIADICPLLLVYIADICTLLVLILRDRLSGDKTLEDLQLGRWCPIWVGTLLLHYSGSDILTVSAMDTHISVLQSVSCIRAWHGSLCVYVIP